jgi:peptidoglycan/xylan/chitin deacetylase (PgdA/CDA1 family)
MCHGIRVGGDKPLLAEHLDNLVRVASDLKFTSINYDDLAAWRAGTRDLPPQPIMFDFDHAVRSVRFEVHEILSRYGFRGNLFINTGPLDEAYKGFVPWNDLDLMTWEQIGELVELGWHIGAHTVTHPNLSKLLAEDPEGTKLRCELEQCDATLEKHLGIKPKDFAYTGTSFSTVAEREVMKRYRFGRLWIVKSTYEADGKIMRYADLVNVKGADDPIDGGPPMAARYITKETPAYRLPSMEFQGLIYTPEAFRRYLEGALT